jgi:hypothetical protein
MKSSHLQRSSFLAPLAGIACLFFAASPQAIASAEDQIDPGLSVSKNWVSEIDDGRYEQSYDEGCDAMRLKVTEERWEQILKALRNPWGNVVDRTQTKHVYKPNGFEGTSGEFLVITYDTNFKKMPGVTEVVVLKWEDGKWHPAGYNAGPKPNDDGSETPSNTATTETHTEPHVRPKQQE